MLRSPDARLYLLFTPVSCRLEPWDTLRAALDGGVDLVQWRVATADPDGLARCQEICAHHTVPVIVNDHVGLAVDSGAAGAHVGQRDLDPTTARAMLGPDRWLGVSTHDMIEIENAIAGGADHLGFGPMFPTTTKGYVRGQPPGALQRAIEATALPIFAIGGITASNVGRVVAAGAGRVAVSAAILAADDPRRAALELRAALDAAG